MSASSPRLSGPRFRFERSEHSSLTGRRGNSPRLSITALSFSCSTAEWEVPVPTAEPRDRFTKNLRTWRNLVTDGASFTCIATSRSGFGSVTPASVDPQKVRLSRRPRPRPRTGRLASTGRGWTDERCRRPLPRRRGDRIRSRRSPLVRPGSMVLPRRVRRNSPPNPSRLRWWSRFGKHRPGAFVLR